MGEVLSVAGCVLLGTCLGAGICALAWRRRTSSDQVETPVADMVRAHFHPCPVEDITISERKFPFRVRADLQRAIDRLFGSETTVVRFCGVRNEYGSDGVSLSDCAIASLRNPMAIVPAQYEEVNIGDAEPVRCLKTGLWLLEENRHPFVVLLAPATHYGEVTGISFQIGASKTPEGAEITQRFFKRLEASVLKSESYRGKILSLERAEHSYSGEATGITVHTLRTVERNQVILPAKTLDLLDRNIIQFVRQRPELARFRQATKKGVLFYGAPGTGKTHTIHYLAKALEGHTTLLITAEQVGLLGEYMTLARLLQPTTVILEDVDLIARDRGEMGSVCDQVLLNKLLNEMDGLTEDADILFILTTNRPESLEHALASRPGRIDQAIEFPLPDDVGRRKLVALYSQGIDVPQGVVDEIVRRTDRVSCAFIKELMRRSVQFHIEHQGSGCLELPDVEHALDEMLFGGGTLNLKLLGAAAVEHESASLK